MSERAKLFRLPSGDWVALDAVTMIKAFPPTIVAGQRLLTRMVIVAGSTHHELTFPGMDEARAYADELAGKVNGDG